MELRQLEYFQAALRLGNITKASEALHVSQPSVTVAIKKLETELGLTLLDRSGRRISPTPEGRTFIARVDAILAAVGDAAAEMRDHRSLVKGSIRIGITPMMGAVLFPNAYARFRDEYPDFQISLVEEGTLSLQSHLEKGEIDLGIMVVSDLPTGLASLPLEQGRIMACMKPGHPLSAYGEIPFGLLKDQPFILFQGDTYSRQMILKECARFRFSPNIAFSSSQIGTVMGLVRQGAGIAFFMEELTRGQESIVVRPLADPLVISVGLAWNPGRYMSKAARAFIDSIRSF